MAIEQDCIQIDGGLVGRGFTDSSVIKFLLSMPSTRDICEEVEKFCDIKFSTTDQHIDARDARIRRDAADVDKMVEWFSTHNPFPFEKKIKNIATGVTGDDKINCYNAEEVGKLSL